MKGKKEEERKIRKKCMMKEKEGREEWEGHMPPSIQQFFLDIYNVEMTTSRCTCI